MLKLTVSSLIIIEDCETITAARVIFLAGLAGLAGLADNNKF